MTSRPCPEQFDNLSDYCDALRTLPWLTPTEYGYLLQETLAWGEEHQAEAAAQYRSEVALFGDAGPGQWTALCEGSCRLAETREAIARVRRIVQNLVA
jgi:hypothetical protein